MRSPRLERNHLTGQVKDGGLHLGLTVLPTRTAELRQLRIALAAADVFLDQVDLRRRNVNADAFTELKDEVFFFLALPALPRPWGRAGGGGRVPLDTSMPR